MGCYWLKDHPTYSNFRNDCNSTQKRIPRLLIRQALATSYTGNYSAAENLLNDAKQRDPNLDITPHLKLARRSASQALIHQAQARTTITSSSELSEDPKVAKDNFDSLMRSRMIEAKFLIDRAKKIDDRVDIEGEMGKLRRSNGELRIKN